MLDLLQPLPQKIQTTFYILSIESKVHRLEKAVPASTAFRGQCCTMFSPTDIINTLVNARRQTKAELI